MAQSPSPETPAILAALEEEAASLQALETALLAERDALTGRDPAAIEAAVADKATRLEQHSRLQAERLARCGGRPLGEIIDALDDQASTVALRDRLLAQGERCEAINRDNGQLIRRQQDRAERALGILRATDSGLRLYAGDGSTERSGDRQSLGKA